MNTINETVKKLMAIIKNPPIDWEAFDCVLQGVDDINYADEYFEETLLTEFLSEDFFFKNGALMPEATRHILKNGYDVQAHEGFNGGIALTKLCWTSYDQHILETAKVLLDAGAPIDYKTEEEDFEEDCDEEEGAVLDNIGWKLSGAWHVDNDPEWANVITAYYYIIKAFKAGKDFHLISSYLDCIGKKLTNVSAFSSEGQDPFYHVNGADFIKEPLVFWFGETPLVVKEIVEFIVDPLLMDEFQGRIVPEDKHFDKIIGSTLMQVRYVNDSTSFLDFDNGYRFLITSVPGSEKKEWKGVYELCYAKMEDLTGVVFDEVYRWDYFQYAERVTSYEETALALVKGKDSYFLFTTEENDGSFHLECIKCDRSLLHEFCLRFPLEKPENPEFFYEKGKIRAMRVKCGEDYFYIKSDGYRGLEIALSKQCINPLSMSTFDFHFGKHMEFERVDM